MRSTARIPPTGTGPQDPSAYRVPASIQVYHTCPECLSDKDLGKADVKNLRCPRTAVAGDLPIATAVFHAELPRLWWTKSRVALARAAPRGLKPRGSFFERNNSFHVAHFHRAAVLDR